MTSSMQRRQPVRQCTRDISLCCQLGFIINLKKTTETDVAGGGVGVHYQLGFIINLKKMALVPSQVMLHLGALIDTAKGLVFPSPALTKTILHAT